MNEQNEQELQQATDNTKSAQSNLSTNDRSNATGTGNGDNKSEGNEGTNGQGSNAIGSTGTGSVSEGEKDKLKQYGNAVLNSDISIVNTGKYKINAEALEITTLNADTKFDVRRVFDEVKVVTGENYDLPLALTPFRVRDNIPRLFEFYTTTALHSSGFEVNRHNAFSTLDQVKLSAQFWNENTLTTRVKLVDKYNDVILSGPNSLAPAPFKTNVLIGANVDTRPIADMYYHRLMTIMEIMMASHNVIHLIPNKITQEQLSQIGSIANSLSKFSLWEGDYAHPYFAEVVSNVSWFSEAMTNLHDKRSTELFIGESSASAENNRKTSSHVSAITDQFATALVNLSTQRLIANQLTPHQMKLFLEANMLRNTGVLVDSVTNPLSLLYAPQEHEWTQYMRYMTFNPQAKGYWKKHLVPLFSSMQRLRLLPYDKVIGSGMIASTPTSMQFKDKFLEAMSVGTDLDIHEVLFMETFSDWFKIDTLRTSSMPQEACSIIDIMSAIAFFQAFPRLANKIAHKLGYRLNDMLKYYDGKSHGDFIDAFGEVREIRDNGKSVKLNYHNYQLTDEQARQGFIYSVFDNLTYPKGSRVQREYFDLMKRMRELCLTDAHPIELIRKKRARYPYYADHYTANMSWAIRDPSDTNVIYRTSFTDKVKSIFRWGIDLMNYRNRTKSLNSKLQRGDISFLESYMDRIREISSSASLPFEYTAATLQECMMNSAAYTLDLYNPQTPFTPPPEIVVQPNKYTENANGIAVHLLHIKDFDINIGLRALLTMEGEHIRNAIGDEFGRTDLLSSIATPSRQFTTFNGDVVHQHAMTILNHAARAGIAQQLIYWLTSFKSSEQNPIKAIAGNMASIMKMSTWKPIIEELFRQVGIDWREFYLHESISTTGIYDGRQLDMVLNLIDPHTGFPLKQPPVGTMFGKTATYVDSFANQALTIISNLMLNPVSPINQTVRGFLLGRFVVQDLAPYQPAATKGWRIVEDENWNIDIVSHESGAKHVIVVKYPDGTHTYDLLRDYNLPRTIFKLKDFTKIRNYLDEVASAILFGNFALDVDHVMVRGMVSDAPMRTIDYSEDMTAAKLKEIMMTSAGQFVFKDFISTEYAMNYTTNANVVPTYLQWLITKAPFEHNLHAAGLQQGMSQHARTVLPPLPTLGYGQNFDGVSLCNGVTNVRKIDEPIVNWNNMYKALTKEVVETVDLTIKYIYPDIISFNDTIGLTH